MKTNFLNRVRRSVAPVALAVAMVAFSPIGALAQNHGGGHGGFGGHSYAGASRGNFSSRSYGGYSGGRAYGGYNRGGNYGVRGYNTGRGSYYGGRGYYRGFHGGGYGYGLGFGLGFYGSPYAYAPPVCNPAGFYDQAGFFHYYPGCAVPPYGY
jgi:hypothetical protein